MLPAVITGVESLSCVRGTGIFTEEVTEQVFHRSQVLSLGQP